MSFGAINNKYENRQYDYTSQKRVVETKVHARGVYKQVLEGQCFTDIFDMRASLNEKIGNGENEETFQIGAQSFTIKEWKEFLDKFDSIQEVMEELMRERHKLQEKEKIENEMAKKILRMEQTAIGFVRIGFDSVSYNDSSDYKKNWHVKFSEETWERLNEWLKESGLMKN